MDPDEALAQIRRLISLQGSRGLDPHELQRLCELVEALDNWLARGGFSPREWTVGSPAER